MWIWILVALFIGVLVVIILSLMSMGSKCSRQEEAQWAAEAEQEDRPVHIIPVQIPSAGLIRTEQNPDPTGNTSVVRPLY